MRLPILAALSWPQKPSPPVGTLDLSALGRLDFFPPDGDRFPALGLARAALRSGGEMPAVLNAANEIAVTAFLAGDCPFNQITATIDAVMENWHSGTHPITSLEQVLQTDAEARRLAVAALGNTTDRSRVQVS
jgi:1-deoxy-D-xylulose-5-phosphate reductoisomerase